MVIHARILRSMAAIVLATLTLPSASHAEPLPVLMVIANRDFWYQEYADVRQALSKRGLPVVVAAGNTTEAVPQASGSGKFVRPNLALTEASAGDYSAVVFVGGWGASQYQYAFGGTYASAVYRSDSVIAQATNQLINEFIAQDKPVSRITEAGYPNILRSGSRRPFKRLCRYHIRQRTTKCYGEVAYFLNTRMNVTAPSTYEAIKRLCALE